MPNVTLRREFPGGLLAQVLPPPLALVAASG